TILFAIGVDQRTALGLGEGELLGFQVIVNDYQVSGRNLLCRNQVRNRVNQETFDRSFQVPRAVLKVDTLFQEELFGFVRALEDKLLAGASHNAILNLTELELEYLLEVIFLEAAEHPYFVDSIHELGREFSFGRLGCCSINLLIDVVLQHSLSASRGEAYRAGDQLAHFLCAEIGRKENHTA